MNSFRQFRSILKFQMAANPFVFLFSFAVSMPAIFQLQLEHPTLDLLLSNQGLFAVAMLGAFVLAPEILFNVGINRPLGIGAEFLITKAVDKRVFARARTVFAILVLAAVPVLIALFSVRSPDLLVHIFSKANRLEVLRLIPGSAVTTHELGRPSLVAIPDGNTLAAVWYVFKIFVVVLAVQVAVYLIYPFKYRRYLFWGLFVVVILAPMIMVYSRIHSHPTSVPSFDERSFLFFATHQLLCWIVATLALVLGQAWCEHRFARLEH